MLLLKAQKLAIITILKKKNNHNQYYKMFEIVETIFFGEKNEKTNKNYPIVNGDFYSIHVFRLRK